MLTLLQTTIAGTAGALLLGALLTTGATTGTASGREDAPPHVMAALLQPGGSALSGLHDIEAEIHHDLCGRAQQRYCLAGACLTLPLQRQCAMAQPPDITDGAF